MKKVIFIGFLILVLAIAGCSSNSGNVQPSGTAGSETAPPEETITLTAASPLLEGAAQSKGFIAWAEELEKRTNGKVKFEQITFGGAVLNASNYLEGLRDGIVDVAFISNAYHPTKTPLTNALQPLYLDDLSGAAEIQSKLFSTVPELREEWLNWKVEPVAWFNGANYILMSNFEFDSMEQLQAKRIRGVGQADSTAMKNLGGIPVSIPAPDAYGALEKGTVDVVGFPTYALQSNKMAEVAKQVTDYRYTGSVMWFGIGFNTDVYNKLPEDVKQVIAEISSLPAEVEAKANFDDAIAGLKLARDNDVRIVQLSPEEAKQWQERINPSSVWEASLKAAEEAGYSNVREIMDEAVKLLEEYNQQNPGRKTHIEQFLEMEAKGQL